MDIMKIIESRHSVRQYTSRKIEEPVRTALNTGIDECNQESGLNIQILYEEPRCFGTMMAHYGKFKGVNNYIALVGKESDELEEQCGYYGEKIILKVQELGLNTCWVASTYGKGKCAAKIEKGEKQICVIALGYGVTQGVPHKNKELSSLSDCTENMPEWYEQGMKAAMLAPTAMNQQKFKFYRNGDDVAVKTGTGFYTKVDLGIVKYHFQSVSGHKVRNQ